jgi:hypothetical protein
VSAGGWRANVSETPEKPRSESREGWIGGMRGSCRLGARGVVHRRVAEAYGACVAVIVELIVQFLLELLLGDLGGALRRRWRRRGRWWRRRPRRSS